MNESVKDLFEQLPDHVKEYWSNINTNNDLIIHDIRYWSDGSKRRAFGKFYYSYDGNSRFGVISFNYDNHIYDTKMWVDDIDVINNLRTKVGE